MTVLERTPPEAVTDETKVRLLHAAGQVFAEQGFERATVRDICSRAKANIAAVNYHFGGKDKLYNASLMFWQAEALKKHPPLLGLGNDAPAEQKLQAFIHSILRRMFDPGRPTWHGQLMAREMISPTSATDQKCVEYIRPLNALLGGIIREIIGQGASEATVNNLICSILGQCVFYFHHRPMLDRLMPDVKFDAESLERIADHISAFSLAGLKAIATEQK